MTKTSKEDCRIEVVKRTRRQMIVMPRFGLKNTIVRERSVSLPRVRCIEEPDRAEEAR